jgi:hypothetical protein
MGEDQITQSEWLNSIIQLVKIGQAKNFLNEEGQFDVTLTSEIEKLTIFIKIEPTNIISFPKVN